MHGNFSLIFYFLIYLSYYGFVIADLGAKGPCSISILEGLIIGWNGLIGLDSVISLQIRVFYHFIDFITL